MYPDNTNSSIPASGLPPIQLPPPLMHYYIAPLTTAPDDYKLLTEKVPPRKSKSKRRTSHSAIEKRRRERMNDKIEKLKTLIPSCTSQFPISVHQPIHKLSVLQAAVDYIEELHEKLKISLPEDDPLLEDLSAVLKKNHSLS